MLCINQCVALGGRAGNPQDSDISSLPGGGNSDGMCQPARGGARCLTKQILLSTPRPTHRILTGHLCLGGGFLTLNFNVCQKSWGLPALPQGNTLIGA